MFWISDFLKNSTDSIFWISAIIGTTLFVLRMLMTFFGGALDVDDSDIDFFEGGHEHHAAPSFKFFTLHSLSGFFMMFGWVGLASSQQMHLSAGHSLVIAFLGGFCAMALVALMFRGALFLQGSGSVFSLDKTVGLVGTVYQRIASDGQGKIHLLVNGVTREILAQSSNKKTIESFTLVKVVKVIDYEIVEVTQYGKDSL